MFWAIALHGRRSPYPLTHDEREAKVRRRAGRLAGAGNCELDSSALYSEESASVLARVQRRVRGDQTPQQKINQIEPDSHVETPVEFLPRPTRPPSELTSPQYRLVGPLLVTHILGPRRKSAIITVSTTR